MRPQVKSALFRLKSWYRYKHFTFSAAVYFAVKELLRAFEKCYCGKNGVIQCGVCYKKTFTT